MDGFLDIILLFMRSVIGLEVFLYFLAAFAFFGVVLLILRAVRS